MMNDKIMIMILYTTIGSARTCLKYQTVRVYRYTQNVCTPKPIASFKGLLMEEICARRVRPAGGPLAVRRPFRQPNNVYKQTRAARSVL